MSRSWEQNSFFTAGAGGGGGGARAASFTAEAGAEAVVASLLKPETLFLLKRREKPGAHLLYRLQNAWSM
jgi:hypothetical protein